MGVACCTVDLGVDMFFTQEVSGDGVMETNVLEPVESARGTKVCLNYRNGLEL